MKELFGVEMSALASVLAILLASILLIVLFLGVRNRILVKLALRNLPRRPAQTVLIIVGLMLSTTIISASLAIGDTVTSTIRKTVIDSLGNTDIRIRSPLDPQSIIGNEYLEPDLRDAAIAAAESDSRVDGVLPQIRETLPVLNTRTQLTEARMTVVGFDPGRMEGFGAITSTAGEDIAIASLSGNEALLNETAAEEIGAAAGDELVLVTPTGRNTLILKAVVRDGGLAANDDRLVMALPALQQLLGRGDEVNRIDISVLGGAGGSEKLSEEVADRLRIEFTDPGVAARLFDTLSDQQVIDAIEARVAENPGDTIDTETEDDLEAMVSELGSGAAPSDNFRSIAVKPVVAGQVVAAIEAAGLREQLLPVTLLFFQLELLGVDELKQDGLRLAELFGNQFVSLFTVFGSFSIIVGLLLIFLVFVMLAAERSSEMGIARAVGTKRRHLVQMFTFEGVAYAIGAAIVGTVIGIAASRLLVILLVNAISADSDSEGIEFVFSITGTSLVAGFSLGLLLTLATVGFSAYRVSKLNIVVAIRGLPEELVPGEVLPLKERLQRLGIAIISPFWQLRQIATAGSRGESRLKEFLLFLAYMALVPWYGRISLHTWRLVRPYFGTGIPQIAIGLVGAIGGSGSSSAFMFSMFTSLLLVGIGQLFRWQAYRRGMRREVSDRIGFTLMGVLVLVFWGLPFDTLEGITGELDGGIEMFVLSGVWMVASAVWIVMYNADLITRVIEASLGRSATLRPVLKLAIAYPTASRFRTGLTVAMFALVIFTMMVLSILINFGSDLIDTPDKTTGGFDIRAETSPDLPIDDFGAALAASPNLDADDFVLIASSTDLQAEARQEGAEELRFLQVPVRGVDDSYLENVKFELSHYDPAYLPEGIDRKDRLAVARAIWERLAEDPSLALVSNGLLEAPAGGGFGPLLDGFMVEGISQDDDDEIEAVSIRIRGARGEGETVTRTVIGAIDPSAGIFESDDGSLLGVITTSARIFDDIATEPVPLTTHRIRLADGVDPARTAAALETEFLDNSLLATDTFGEIEESLAQSAGFQRLFQSFLGLGLVVGVASLGVLSFRAVVERRLSIGMMRAIGYKGRMIQLQFLIESVFVTILGTVLGLGLGALISWNIVNSIQEQFDGLAFAIPWATVSVIVVIALLAALLTTYIPARQASRIYPSEALRYE